MLHLVEAVHKVVQRFNALRKQTLKFCELLKKGRLRLLGFLQVVQLAQPCLSQNPHVACVYITRVVVVERSEGYKCLLRIVKGCGGCLGVGNGL